MTTPARPQVARRAPRWVWIVMVVSLAINLLVLGGALGAAWHFRYIRALGNGAAPHHFGAFVATLPRAKRQQIDAILSAQRVELQPLRQAVRQARREVGNAFAAEPFDKERFRTLNLAYIEARSRVLEARAKAYPDIISILDASERKAFLRWRHWRRSWRHRWRRHGSGEQPPGNRP